MSIAGVALLIIASLIPGVAFVWGYERWYEIYARKASDWVFRLAAIAAGILAMYAGLIYWLAAKYWEDFKNLDELPLRLAWVPVLYIGIAAALGVLVGGFTRLMARWGRFISKFERLGKLDRWLVMWTRSGRGAPNAWAYLFRNEQTGVVRCKLHSGRWVGGIYEIGSYASAQGPKRDLLIARAVAFDKNGTPRRRSDGEIAYVGGDNVRGSLLVKWDDIETLEFLTLDNSGGTNDD